MFFRTLTLVLAAAIPVVARDLRGTVSIERKVTRKNITAPAGVYQRGIAVPLGMNVEEDALSFELSHVVVFLEDGPKGAANLRAAMEQKDRRFVEDLLVIPVRSTVSFPNSDPIFHNVFSLSKAKSFDLGNYPKGQTRTVTFSSPGIVAVYCRLHPNMAGSIVVTPNRWGTRADSRGTFVLKDVPAGTYTVVAWHKFAGILRKKVSVGPEGDVELDFA